MQNRPNIGKWHLNIYSQNERSILQGVGKRLQGVW